MSNDLPSLAEAKRQAKWLREQTGSEGAGIGHSRALELVAKSYGYRDWNTFHAVIRDRPPKGFVPGERVRGYYLGQPFAATVIDVEVRAPGWYRLSLEADQAIDVVAFDSFSNFRKRISGTVGPEGKSRERTSDGRPHLEVDVGNVAVDCAATD